MKSSIRFFHPASVFFLLTVGVAFLSWVGSIYGWEDVQNFLSAEGLRWALRYTDDNYLCAPMLASLLILFWDWGCASIPVSRKPASVCWGKASTCRARSAVRWG